MFKTKSFLDFINDDSIKDNNEKIKINNNSIDEKKFFQNIDSIKKQNEDQKNKINELENIIKEFQLIIKEKDNIINQYNKIKELELIIKEKNNIIDEYNKIEQLKNISNNNKYIDRIKELEKEIEKYKAYCLLPGEKLISIKFISTDQTINFDMVAKNTDNFIKLESSLYEKYPKYKETENFFLVNGKKLQKHKTLDENKINDNDVITLEMIDE